MLTLGIADGQTSGACVTDGGRILSAVNEERIVRIKQARGFPRASIAEALRLAGARPEDIGHVALADLRNRIREKIDGWPGWFEARSEGRDGVKDYFFRTAARFGWVVPYVPGIRHAYYGLRAPIFAHRRRRIGEIMRDEFGIGAPVDYYHHHYCHAASAYYTSGFEDALVITMDGGGDGDCSHVYSARDGRLEKLASVGSYHSLGNYYAYVTVMCGYRAKRHEGKITGLAAHGDPVHRELFESLIGCENGKLVNRGRALFTAALDKIRQGLPEEWSREDLAATIQIISEEITRRFVRHWQQRTGHRNVALAGGLFANVRINEEVLRVDGVDRVFIHPGMTDEGLFVGAALATDHAVRARESRPYEPRTLDTVYLGTDIEEREAESALREASLKFQKPADMAGHVAELLHGGAVVARAVGRMEYGPRALGNRTIMYRPDDPSVNDWLNELLRRTEFMPFAPASRFEDAGRLYIDADGGLDAARFMTITFHCTPFMRDSCPGVVHIDDTARPQLVRRDENEGYYDIIEAYERLSGRPAVINTSFNIHEEPIVRTAEDAVRAFLDSRLDYLQLGPFVAEGPVGSAETRKSWEGRSVWGRRRELDAAESGSAT